MTKAKKSDQGDLGTLVPGYSPELGKRIRDLLEEFDSLKDAAALVDMKPEMLRRYEDGLSKPSFYVMADLCKAANRSLDWLAYGERPSDPEVVPFDQKIMISTIMNAMKILANSKVEVSPSLFAGYVVTSFMAEMESRNSDGDVHESVARLFREMVEKYGSGEDGAGEL
ncbi:MAG: helix-turn-helix domain-containing protein [Magnetovibrionaceae bacterium]